MRIPILFVAVAACRGHASPPLPSSADAPSSRPVDFAITVREANGSGVLPPTLIRITAAGVEVGEGTVPPTIRARFTPSADDLDALYAAYVASDLDHAPASPLTASDAPEIIIDAVAAGHHTRFVSPRPNARADAIAALVDPWAARAIR